MSDEPHRPRQWRDTGMTLFAVGVLIILISNLFDIVRAHGALVASRDQMTQALGAGGKAETQLNALANGTAQLAKGGNANAQAVIDTLQKNGINIGQPAAGAGAANVQP